MTAVMTRADQQLWNTMPGWGIVADLTPPELVAIRRLRVLRKLIVVGLAAVVVLCAGGYVLAMTKHSAAASAVGDANARTTQLQAEANKYSRVTRIQGSITQIQGKVATLMKTDVNLPELLGKIRADLPGSMAISQLTLTLTKVPGSNAAGSVLDTSGHIKIGSVTMSGSGRTLDDLPAYVDHLNQIPGLSNVVPGSNTAGARSTQFSLTFDLTDQLYSHRYDVSTAGGK
ncbi:MAG: Fimbrial assembly family protein [Pseudonocardiales bacterium]|nr:Fimbrial assembly family protein [Pseudonocardiales bacterium]